jgi:hypothetical protein
MDNDWWKPRYNYARCAPSPTILHDWWAPSHEDIDSSTHLEKSLQRLDSVLAEFKKWVDTRFPIPVSLAEPNIERALFDILCPPDVDPEHAQSEYTTENGQPVYPMEEDAPKFESEPTRNYAPLVSPTLSLEEHQSIGMDTENDATSPPPFQGCCQIDTLASAPAPTSVSALTPAENCSIVKSSKGYTQITDLVKSAAILRLRVNSDGPSWLTSPHRPLTCSESGLLPEPPPFPRRFSCSGSMNYVF